MIFTYEQIKDLKIKCDTVLRKKATIHDVDCMLSNLAKQDEKGKLAMPSCFIEIGSDRLGLSKNEYPYIIKLLEEARSHTHDVIEEKEREIKKIFEEKGA